jgi:prephenate dehydratase
VFDHCLLALPGATIDDLRELISRPQAIAQCEEFLNALEIDVRAEYKTAGAAKRITEERLPAPRHGHAGRARLRPKGLRAPSRLATL